MAMADEKRLAVDLEDDLRARGMVDVRWTFGKRDDRHPPSHVLSGRDVHTFLARDIRGTSFETVDPSAEAAWCAMRALFSEERARHLRDVLERVTHGHGPRASLFVVTALSLADRAPRLAYAVSSNDAVSRANAQQRAEDTAKCEPIRDLYCDARPIVLVDGVEVFT